MIYLHIQIAFSALTLLAGGQKGPVKTEWWGAGVVVCLEQGADLHMAQLTPLPLTVSCFTKIQIGFTFLVQALLDSPGKKVVKRVCVIYLQRFLYDTNDECIITNMRAADITRQLPALCTGY